MGHFSSINEFLAMGGYGVYVWSAFTIVLLTMLGTAIWPVFRLKKLLAELKRVKNENHP